MIRPAHLIAAALVSFGIHFAVADDAKHPMPPDVRERFDKVMADLWHEDCGCWRFIYKGNLDEVTPPVDDDLAWAILDLVERGKLLPVKRGGDSS